VNRTFAGSTRSVGADGPTTILKRGPNVLLSASRAPLISGLALLAVASLCVQSAAAQTPTVQLTNLTRGGTNFIVGDEWRIDITGPPHEEVKVCATHNGQSLGCTVYGETDATGRFVLSGIMDPSTVGSWVETWYVGGVQATPVLHFEVYPPPCEGFAVPVPPVMVSQDYYYWPYQYYPDQISPGSAVVGAELTTAHCAFVFTSVEPLGYPPMISADLALFSPLTVIWQAYDNMDLGAYGFDERCYYCYYPIVQSAGFTFIAVDPYLNTYIVNTGVGLYVEKVLL